MFKIKSLEQEREGTIFPGCDTHLQHQDPVGRDLWAVLRQTPAEEKDGEAEES